MKINLTNEELALFFTKDLKGDILNAITEKYRIINPILILENIYPNNINWDVAENSICSYFDKTQICIEFPIKDSNNNHAMFFENIILCNQNTRLDDYDLIPKPQKTKFNHIIVELLLSTYDFGTGQDIIRDDEEFDIDNVECIPTISPNAKFKLSMTIERVIDDINTLDELTYDDISTQNKLDLLNNSTIKFHDNIYAVINSFIISINNNEKNEQHEDIYTYSEEHNTINIFKTNRTTYKNKLIASFTLVL